MEITRRRSERAKVKKATYTPGKLVTKEGKHCLCG
jgi:hypothetical protein